MKRLEGFKGWAAAVVAAALLELPFPLAGPMPPWRGIFAWFGLVPLLWAILRPETVGGARPLRKGFLLAYLCGFLWYAGNCYWIYDTMAIHGGIPPVGSALMLVGYSLVLGLYFGAFGFAVALVRRATGSTRLALAAAPVFWAGLELLASRITSVPWDQLGYSQVDNGLVNQLAPWTGVYGISFALVAANALVAGGLVVERSPARRWRDGLTWGIAGLLLVGVGAWGVLLPSPRPAATATAVLVQPNLDVQGEGLWQGPGEWDAHIAEFVRLAAEQCKGYIAGIPETGASQGEVVCPPYATHPDLVAWPESPAPYFQGDARFEQAMKQVAQDAQAPLVVGSIGEDFSEQEQAWHQYNSAMVWGRDGGLAGRYDKIHLVPFGEFVPYRELFFFAHKLTGKVSEFSRGQAHKVFSLSAQDGKRHRYGVFICYEAVFADEVREFAQLGAEVLVNVSDDGWYGDTSAPWQHLNMARMRAIENRRWVLRDTNNGVTASIDPYGTVRQSIPRHAVDALPAQFGFRDDVTFYTAHGDVFGWGCALLSAGLAGWAGKKFVRQLTSRAA